MASYAFRAPALPALNEYVDAERANRFAAAGLKKKVQARIRRCLEDAPAFDGAVRVYIVWYQPNRRKDIDNTVFAKKFVLDALQEAGVIKSDRFAMCYPVDVDVEIDSEHPRIEVRITDEIDKEEQAWRERMKRSISAELRRR